MIYIKYILLIIGNLSVSITQCALCSLLPLQSILANLVVKKMCICSSKKITGRITKTNKT